MSYVDGFVMVAPTKNIPAYKTMAAKGAKIWKKYGALEYFECVADDMRSKHVTLPFPKMIRAKKNETVIFSFIVFKSKKHREQVNARVMKDPYMDEENWKNTPMPFDMKRMAYGGFKVIVQA